MDRENRKQNLMTSASDVPALLLALRLLAT